VNRRANQADAIAAFVATVVVMVFVIFGVWHDPSTGWTFVLNPGQDAISERGLRAIAWPWYTVLGATLTVGSGSLLSLRHR
jgi:hypothetical protein